MARFGLGCGRESERRQGWSGCLFARCVSHGQAAEREADDGHDVDGSSNTQYSALKIHQESPLEMKAAMPNRRLKQACLVCNMASFPGMVFLDWVGPIFDAVDIGQPNTAQGYQTMAKK